MPIDGVTYVDPVDGTVLFLDGRVRIFFLSGGRRYFYRDFDVRNECFSPIRVVLCISDKHRDPSPLTDEAVERHLRDHGMSGYNLLLAAR